MPTDGNASTPPDLEKLHNTLLGMEETIRRVRNFICALGWSAARFRERYGVAADECDAFDAVLNEADRAALEVFRAWDQATDAIRDFEKGN